MLEAKIQQIALAPERRCTWSLLIDAAAEQFHVRHIGKFVVVRAPAGSEIVDYPFITLDVVHQRQDIHLLHFQFAEKRFGRRDADSRLCVNGQWRLEYLVVA